MLLLVTGELEEDGDEVPLIICNKCGRRVFTVTEPPRISGEIDDGEDDDDEDDDDDDDDDDELFFSAERL